MRLLTKHITPKRLPARIVVVVAVILLWGAAIIPSNLAAQSAGFAGSFSRIGFGPRGMAMGNALTAVIDEGIYAYYNPAHAALRTEGNQVDLSTSILSFDRSLHSVNGTFRLPPNAGLGLSVINGNVSGIDGRDASGYPTGELSTHEYQFLGAFGLRLGRSLYAGLGFKYTVANYHTSVDNAGGFGFDLGFLLMISDRLSVGATVRDLLSKYSWNTGSFYNEESAERITDRFPVRSGLGISYRVTDALLATLEGGLLSHPETGSAAQFKLGGRYRIHDRITLRGGWQVVDTEDLKYGSHLSAGFSVNLPFDLLAPSVDYAFVPEPNSVSSMHVFGLRLNL